MNERDEWFQHKKRNEWYGCIYHIAFIVQVTLVTLPCNGMCQRPYNNIYVTDWLMYAM